MMCSGATGTAVKLCNLIHHSGIQYRRSLEGDEQQRFAPGVQLSHSSGIPFQSEVVSESYWTKHMEWIQ